MHATYGSDMSNLPWPTAPPDLHGERVLLRPWRRDDAAAVERAAAEAPELQDMIGAAGSPYVQRTGIGLFEAFVGPFARDQWRTRVGAQWAVTDADAEVVGSCGLSMVDPVDLVAAVGGWTAASARRRGYAREALAATSEWALSEGGLGRLEAMIDPDNAPSLAAAKSVGFRREGLLRGKTIIDGQRRDLVLLARLAEQPAHER